MHASFSPDGQRLVTASDDGTARLWDLTQLPPSATVLAGHTRAVVHASFSLDGQRLVTAGADRTARLWDLTQVPPSATVLAGHTGRVLHASFSPDGQRLVTASADRTAMIWPTPPLDALLRLATAARTRGLTVAEREAFGLPIPPDAPADRNAIPPPPR
jgi:WD40 repeat protein